MLQSVARCPVGPRAPEPRLPTHLVGTAAELLGFSGGFSPQVLTWASQVFVSVGLATLVGAGVLRRGARPTVGLADVCCAAQ